MACCFTAPAEGKEQFGKDNKVSRPRQRRDLIEGCWTFFLGGGGGDNEVP